MLIHGVRPGPLIMLEFPTFINETVAMVLIATIMMYVLGLSMVRSLVKVLMVPRQKLMPIIFVLCVVGSFAIQSRVFDIWVMVVFGLLGFILREMEYPMAPLVLGIILGDIPGQEPAQGPRSFERGHHALLYPADLPGGCSCSRSSSC